MEPNIQTALPRVNHSLARNLENTNHQHTESPPLHQTTNPFNDEDENTSDCVQAFFGRMVADNVKHDFMAGPYCCAEDDRQSATLHGFLGGKIPESNPQIAVASRMLHPNPDLVS